MAENDTTLPLKDRVKGFYEKVSSDGAAALAELPNLYAADVHFVNPVVDQTGLPAFEEQWTKALKQYKTFEFVGIEVIGDERIFTLSYSMNIRFSFGPTFTTAMMTDCHAENGKVTFCRDYFDVVGSLVDPFPPIAWIYKKIFGLLVA